MTGLTPLKFRRVLTGACRFIATVATRQHSRACSTQPIELHGGAFRCSTSRVSFARAIRFPEGDSGGAEPPPSSIVDDHAALHLALLHQLEGMVQLREGQAPADHLLELILLVHEEVEE